MRLEDFDYHLPFELIAQRPAAERDESRLMVVRRRESAVEHSRFSKLSTFMRAGDLLVLNDTRVIKCRFHGADDAGRSVELLLVREAQEGIWEALARPGKRAKTGARISLAGGIAEAEVVGLGDSGRRLVRIESDHPLPELMAKAGHVPLPPYIKRPDDTDDVSRYQTVYAVEEGAVAAPTAGLHFTPQVLNEIKKTGVQLAWVTLHVGPGTFRPVRTKDPREHRLDPEWFRLEPDQAEALNKAKLEGRRVVCVGTTVARVMETVARAEASDGLNEQASDGPNARASDEPNEQERDGHLWLAEPMEGWTDKYILPPYKFKIVDALLTNFHLPRTTLLMLVAALAGRELILRAYSEAVSERYRFYSYGDAMLIL